MKPIYATHGNLTAVDHLGRKLPEYGEVPEKRDGKTVGLFYYLWHGYHGTQGPYDITEILKRDPNAMMNADSPAWPPAEHTPMLHWGEPMFGYYVSTDPWVLRRHVEMFITAGVDVLFFDVTNGFTYKKCFFKLFEILREYNNKGFKAPKVCFYTAPAIRGCGTGNLAELWECLYEPMLYSDLWFYWKGKPLIICHSIRSLPDRVREFFTWRAPTWREPEQPCTWAWEGNPQKVAVDENGVPEEIAVNVSRVDCDPNYNSDGMTVGMGSAAYGVPVMGRSWHNGHKDTRENASHYGFLFEEQARYALEKDPPVAFLCQWNEWLVPFLTQKTNTLYGMGNRPIHLQDEFNEEYSRDLEPMRGGYGDAYYLHMIAFIRRFKGLEAPAVADKMYRFDPNDAFAGWDGVYPIYREMTGDIAPRDWHGYDAVGRYTNYTGRNEFSVLKAAVDETKIRFYAACQSVISAPAPEDWMTLYIKTQNDALPNWEGYHFAVNRTAPKQNRASLEAVAVDGTYRWKSIGEAEIRVCENRIVLILERAALGLSESNVRLEFKWTDNMQEHTVAEFYQNGDAAPRGRLNYLFCTDFDKTAR